MESSSSLKSIYKIIILGDVGCGKTTILFKYTDNPMDLGLSIGTDFKAKTLNVGDDLVRLQIWDTSGQERFKTLTRNFFRGSHGVVYVFDLTRPETFENIQRWYNDYKLFGNTEAEGVLLGHKFDLKSERKIDYEIALATAESMNMKYFETSAFETSDCISQAFTSLAHRVHFKFVEKDADRAQKKASENNIDLGQRDEENQSNDCPC